MNSTMKYSQIFIVALALTSVSLVSCNKVVDEVGFSDFLLDNQTDQNLVIEVYMPEDKMDLTVEAMSDVVILNEVAGDFGTHAFPEDFIDSILVYDQANQLIFTDSGIVDEEWQHETPQGYVWWERAIYTYEITEDLLGN
jgi:hypothetical protein